MYARSQIETLGAKYLNFPNDLDSQWYEGFCSEVQVIHHKNGRPYTLWEKLSGIRNEPLDTSISRTRSWIPIPGSRERVLKESPHCARSSDAEW